MVVCFKSSVSIAHIIVFNKMTGTKKKVTKILLTDEDKMDVIRLWEGEMLYNVTHHDYHNNNKRNAALKRIADEMVSDVTFAQVKDVMKSLRTIYLKERRKIDESRGTGKGAHEIYVSKWKFINELHFLQPYTRPVHTESSLSKSPDIDERYDIDDIQVDEEDIDASLQDDPPTVRSVG